MLKLNVSKSNNKNLGLEVLSDVYKQVIESGMSREAQAKLDRDKKIWTMTDDVLETILALGQNIDSTIMVNIPEGEPGYRLSKSEWSVPQVLMDIANCMQLWVNKAAEDQEPIFVCNDFKIKVEPHVMKRYFNAVMLETTPFSRQRKFITEFAEIGVRSKKTSVLWLGTLDPEYLQIVDIMAESIDLQYYGVSCLKRKGDLVTWLENKLTKINKK